MGNFLTGIDIGTSKVAVAVGEKDSSGVRIVSYQSQSLETGIKVSEIFNENKVSEALAVALKRSEEAIGEKINEAVVNISGKVLHSSEEVRKSIRPREQECIGHNEIDELRRNCYKITLPEDECIYEVAAQSYDVDDCIGMSEEEVTGMCGKSIEGKFKLISGKKSLLERRLKVLSKCGIAMKKAILSPIATAAAVITEQESENGVAIVDFGKGTTEIAIIKDHLLRDVSTIPFGSDSITNDIKTIATVSYKWAELVKLQYGCCVEEFTQEEKKLLLKGEDGTEAGEIELVLLTRVVEARMSEILDAIYYRLNESGYINQIPGGIVITGGGCYLERILELAREILGTRRVRLAAPRSKVTDDSVEDCYDAYASTAVGLVLEGFENKYTNANGVEKYFEQPAVSTDGTLTIVEGEEDAKDPDDDDEVEEENRSHSIFDIIFGPKEQKNIKKEPAQQEKKQPEEGKKKNTKKVKVEEQKEQPSLFDDFFGISNNN